MYDSALTTVNVCDFLLCVGVVILVFYCQAKKQNSEWKRIGTYEGAPLYERMYASGKKSWRFNQDNEFHYMNATPVPGVEFRNSSYL